MSMGTRNTLNTSIGIDMSLNYVKFACQVVHVQHGMYGRVLHRKARTVWHWVR